MSEASDFIHDLVLLMPDSWKAPWTKLGPGQVILKMSQEKRDIIKNLKSEDLQNVRPDSCFMFQEPRRKGRWGL